MRQREVVKPPHKQTPWIAQQKGELGHELPVHLLNTKYLSMFFILKEKGEERAAAGRKGSPRSSVGDTVPLRDRDMITGWEHWAV